MKIIRRAIHALGRAYIRRICESEQANQTFRENERPVEYRFALEALAARRPRSVLDVGPGLSSWPHVLSNCGYVVTAIDNVRDYWPQGVTNRHWPVLDVDITSVSERIRGPFDAITCISVLEHIRDHVAAVRSMTSLLKEGGQLIVTTPFSFHSAHPNVYERPDALYGGDLPYICRSSSQGELDEWLGLGLTIKRQELWRMFTGSVWATGERCPWELVENVSERHQLGCFEFEKGSLQPGP